MLAGRPSRLEDGHLLFHLALPESAGSGRILSFSYLVFARSEDGLSLTIDIELFLFTCARNEHRLSLITI